MSNRVKAAYIFSLAVLVILLSSGNIGQAQVRPESQVAVLDPATRSEVIEVTLKRISESYVFPEVAKQIEDVFRERLKRKDYDWITSPAKLAEVLTSQLREIS